MNLAMVLADDHPQSWKRGPDCQTGLSPPSKNFCEPRQDFRTDGKDIAIKLMTEDQDLE